MTADTVTADTVMAARATADRAMAPWDVPVRLVDVPDGPRRVLRVDPGVALPGVTAIDVTLVTPLDGAPAVVAVEPVRSAAPEGVTSDGSLAGLLATLRDADAGGSVPVAVDGTPFTRAVLAALAAVPAGTRITYSALATAAGRPRAVRAAATVMARNRVPLLLPCHRVVPTGGGVGRYGWGADVKRTLLATEALE